MLMVLMKVAFKKSQSYRLSLYTRKNWRLRRHFCSLRLPSDKSFGLNYVYLQKVESNLILKPENLPSASGLDKNLQETFPFRPWPSDVGVPHRYGPRTPSTQMSGGGQEKVSNDLFSFA